MCIFGYSHPCNCWVYRSKFYCLHVKSDCSLCCSVVYFIIWIWACFFGEEKEYHFSPFSKEKVQQDFTSILFMEHHIFHFFKSTPDYLYRCYGAFSVVNQTTIQWNCLCTSLLFSYYDSVVSGVSCTSKVAYRKAIPYACWIIFYFFMYALGNIFTCSWCYRAF